MRKLACITVAAVLAVSLTGCAAPRDPIYKVYDENGDTGRIALVLTECTTEDSDNCYWDAATMGNGEGTSFVVIDGVVFFPEME